MLWFKSKNNIGLDIGNQNIKVCELNVSSKTAKLTKFHANPVSEKGYKNGEVVNENALSSSIKSGLKNFSAKNISIGISGAAVIVKKITIPRIDSDLLPEQIKWEAEQYIPYNIEEVVMDYVEVPSDSEDETMDIIIVAAQKPKMQKFITAIDSIKSGKVGVVDVAGFALSNCFTFNYPEYKNKTVGILDIGAFFTHFIVLENNQIVFSRDLPTGGKTFDEAISKNLGVSESEAIKLKHAKKEIPDLALDTINSISKKVADQMVGSYEFFSETNPDTNIVEFFITGGASQTTGFAEILAQTLNKEVKFMDLFKKISISDKVLSSSDRSTLQYCSAVALGLSLRNAGDS